MGLCGGGVTEGAHVSYILHSCPNALQGSINNRMNILHMLDSLCEASLLAKSQLAFAKAEGISSTSSLYVDYVSKDLGKIVEAVVPIGREGLPNLMSTKQVCQNPALLA